MQFDHLNFNEDDELMSIEDLRALRLQKKKIDSDKKAREYILDINQRYRKMSRLKNNIFLECKSDLNLLFKVRYFHFMKRAIS